MSKDFKIALTSFVLFLLTLFMLSSMMGIMTEEDWFFFPIVLISPILILVEIGSCIWFGVSSIPDSEGDTFVL